MNKFEKFPYAELEEIEHGKLMMYRHYFHKGNFNKANELEAEIRDIREVMYRYDKGAKKNDSY